MKLGKVLAISTQLCAAVLLTIVSSDAQTAATGALIGTVTDPQGQLVAEAQITATNQATNAQRLESSTANGEFRFPLLPPGAYSLEVDKAGFKRAKIERVQIVVTETQFLNIHLEVGGITETVSVEGSAVLAQTESSALGRVVDEKVVDNLPLVTRNYTEILGLSPGVTVDVNDAGALGNGSRGDNLYVHGSRPFDNNFQMNGVGVNDLQNSGSESGGVPIPNPDTILEFKVQTGQYDASFGRNSGAAIDVVTKGGGNEFHGTVFEFFRNNVLNANDFFSKESGQPRSDLKQNQYGFTLGGPVKKDKLFFFTSYQGTRQINGVSNTPPTKSKDSFFSPPFSDDRSAAAIGTLFAGQRGLLQNLFGGVGPAILADGSNINPVALQLLQLKLPDGKFLIPTPQIVDPSQPFDTQGFSVFSLPSTFNEDQFMINSDFQHTSKSRFSERFYFANSDQSVTLPVGNVPGFPRNSQNQFRDVTLSHAYTFSANLTNSAEFGFSRVRVASQQATPFTYSQLNVIAPPQSNDLPLIDIVGSGILGGAFPVTIAQNNFVLQDSLAYVRGRHLFRFGAGVTRTQDNVPDFRFNGELVFLSWPDFLLGLDGADNGTGLFSNVFESVDFIGLPQREFRVRDWYGFVQDDIKVFPALTLNIGLRYDRIGQFDDRLGRNANFNFRLADPNPPLSGSLAGYVVPSNFSGGAVPSGVKQLGNSFGTNGDGLNNVAPRLGFAWQPLPDSARVVFRGGYGIFYSRPAGDAFIQLISSPPFTQFGIGAGPSLANATFANPFPQPIPPLSSFPFFPTYSPQTALNITSIAPTFRPAIDQQYSLNVQEEVVRDLLLEVGYVGSRSTHLLRARSMNQAGLASAADPIRGETTNTVANIADRVDILGWTSNGINEVQSSGSSWYNGLEASLTKRFSHGLQFLASYTFAKTLDTDAAAASLTWGGSGIPGNQLTQGAGYGETDFDRRHRFVISWLYELPNPANPNTLLGRSLGGWAISGVGTFQSGQALTITGTNANNVYGITFDRAQIAPNCSNSQLVNGGSVKSKLSNYFNQSCFADWPVVGDDGMATGFGNSGSGIVNGPAQASLDLAIIKRTKLLERLDSEFRAEFFNAFNTPQFANPDTTFGSATFGIISATSANPRVIQLALKIQF